MYVYIYVCMYVYIHIYTYIYTYIRVCACCRMHCVAYPTPLLCVLRMMTHRHTHQTGVRLGMLSKTPYIYVYTHLCMYIHTHAQEMTHLIAYCQRPVSVYPVYVYTYVHAPHTMYVFTAAIGFVPYCFIERKSTHNFHIHTHKCAHTHTHAHTHTYTHARTHTHAP